MTLQVASGVAGGLLASAAGGLVAMALVVAVRLTRRYHPPAAPRGRRGETD